MQTGALSFSPWKARMFPSVPLDPSGSLRLLTMASTLGALGSAARRSTVCRLYDYIVYNFSLMSGLCQARGVKPDRA